MTIEKQYSPTYEEIESENTNSISLQVLRSLMRSDEYRHSFVEESIRTRLAIQIRMMRESQPVPWDYKTFAEKLGKKVSWAYRLEDPNETTPTISTLLQVAKAFDVALDVRFVPFSSLIRDTTTLTPHSFEVLSFDQELPGLEQELASEARYRNAFSALTPAYNSPSAWAEALRALTENIQTLADQSIGDISISRDSEFGHIRRKDMVVAQYSRPQTNGIYEANGL